MNQLNGPIILKSTHVDGVCPSVLAQLMCMAFVICSSTSDTWVYLPQSHLIIKHQNNTSDGIAKEPGSIIHIYSQLLTRTTNPTTIKDFLKNPTIQGTMRISSTSIVHKTNPFSPAHSPYLSTHMRTPLTNTIRNSLLPHQCVSNLDQSYSFFLLIYIKSTGHVVESRDGIWP